MECVLILTMRRILIGSFIARVGLLLYGAWQDAVMDVKFTDVDYYVFSDAAQFVSQGKSPYLRSTYRYTPLLAWMLCLNSWLSPLFGKLVFILFDILIGHILYRLLLKLGHSATTAKNCSLLWLCNPLAATVSSRGNAESVMGFLVIASLYCLMDRKIIPAAVIYALAIHVKIYPVTYALPIYLYLGDESGGEALRQKNERIGTIHAVKYGFIQLLPNKERVQFGIVSASVLGGLTLVFYQMYGWIFIYETYLYHIVRGDIRHNFSPYFYLLYLTADRDNGVPLYLRLLVFLPQMILLLAVSVKFYRKLPLCWFLCTFVFVMANKVCTSQYFLWYLSLLPIIAPQLRLSMKSGIAILCLWFAGQALWLCPAYFLEFESHNTFLLIWMAGLVFYLINAIIVYFVITTYDESRIKRNNL